MKEVSYGLWVIAIWIAIMSTSCTNSAYQKDILKELREINRELYLHRLERDNERTR